MVTPIAALILAVLQAAQMPPAEAAALEAPVRQARPFSLALSPELYVLHAQKFPDMTATLGVRVGASVTSRVAVGAFYGWLPGLIHAVGVGVIVTPFEGPLSPYAGAELGALRMLDDEGPDTTDPFALGVLGVSFAARNGLELAAEGAAGWEREGGPGSRRDSLLLRTGLRIGYRFGAGR
jgi:hypothetical protein